MGSAVDSILKILDKKPAKAITTFQIPCLEGKSKKEQSLSVTVIQSLRPHLCSNYYKASSLSSSETMRVPDQSNGTGGSSLNPLASRRAKALVKPRQEV